MDDPAVYHARFNCLPCRKSWGARVSPAVQDAQGITNALRDCQKCNECKKPGNLIKLVKHDINWRLK